jgi:hypothetical protein
MARRPLGSNRFRTGHGAGTVKPPDRFLAETMVAVRGAKAAAAFRVR